MSLKYEPTSLPQVVDGAGVGIGALLRVGNELLLVTAVLSPYTLNPTPVDQRSERRCGRFRGGLVFEAQRLLYNTA